MITGGTRTARLGMEISTLRRYVQSHQIHTPHLGADQDRYEGIADLHHGRARLRGAANARVLRLLESRLLDAGMRGPLLVMQSNGGLMRPSDAEQRPALMTESGPAAGVMGAAAFSETLDMYRTRHGRDHGEGIAN